LEASQHPVLDCLVRAVQGTVALMAGPGSVAGNRSSRLFVDAILWDDNRIIKPVSHCVVIKNHVPRGRCDNAFHFVCNLFIVNRDLAEVRICYGGHPTIA
jgi:hypothetical protein